MSLTVPLTGSHSVSVPVSVFESLMTCPGLTAVKSPGEDWVSEVAFDGSNYKKDINRTYQSTKPDSKHTVYIYVQIDVPCFLALWCPITQISNYLVVLLR